MFHVEHPKNRLTLCSTWNRNSSLSGPFPARLDNGGPRITRNPYLRDQTPLTSRKCLLLDPERAIPRKLRQFLHFRFTRHQNNPPAGGHKLKPLPNRILHAVHRPQNYAFECRRQFLRAAGMHHRLKSNHPYRLPQKRRLLALRLRQRHRDLRAAQGNRDPRKPSPRPKIKRSLHSHWQNPRTCDRLYKMSRQYPLLVSDRREIHPLIPADKQVEINRKPLRRPAIERIHARSL